MNSMFRLLLLSALTFFSIQAWGLIPPLDSDTYRYDQVCITATTQNYTYDIDSNLTSTSKGQQLGFFSEYSGNEITLAFVDGFVAAKGGTTTLYRAVGPDELADIQKTGQLINRGSGEGKYFTTSAEHASDYAKKAVKAFGDAPYTTVKTKVPTSSLPSPVSVDGGIPAYVVPNNEEIGVRSFVITYAVLILSDRSGLLN